VVATPELTAYVQENFGLEDTVPAGGMNIGGTVECGDAWVTMVRADHSNGIENDPDYAGGMPTGFVIGDKKRRRRPTRTAPPSTTPATRA